MRKDLHSTLNGRFGPGQTRRIPMAFCHLVVIADQYARFDRDHLATRLENVSARTQSRLSFTHLPLCNDARQARMN
jgi:hypothetical protein